MGNNRGPKMICKSLSNSRNVPKGFIFCNLDFFRDYTQLSSDLSYYHAMCV